MIREMKDSGIEWIGEIPTDFQLKRVKNVCVILDQYRKPIMADNRNQNAEILYDYYGASGVIDKIDDYTIDDHVMLIGEDGANLRMRNLPLMYEVNGKAWINNHAHILKPKENNDFYYIFFALEALDINPYITGSAQPKLSQEKLKEIWIPLPTLNEQIKISKFIKDSQKQIDAVIEQTRASIEEYKKLKQSVITQAVTKGIRLGRRMKDSGVAWIDSIPSEWSMERGKGLFIEVDNRSEDGTEELLTVSQYTGITPRRQKNVNMFEAETLEGYKICEVGDIAANTMWLWAGAIGVSKYRGVISPSYNIYRQKSNYFDPTYLDFLLRASPLVQHYESLSTGIRASRLRLYPQQFLSIRYPVPPMNEQEEIVSFLKEKIDGMDSLIQKKEQYLAEIESYKKSLIFEYVTGKKEVR